MLQAFLITLREGLEAFLIVAVALAYLRRIARQALVPAVQVGIVAALALSPYAASLFQGADNQALWDGTLALAGAALVGTLTVHVWRHRETPAVARAGRVAFAVAGVFTVLMITRKGMQTALLMGTLLFQLRAADIIAGAVAGIVTAALVAWLWGRYAGRLNRRLFFQLTLLFLVLFLAQLLLYGVHRLTEGDVLPYSGPLYRLTEPFGPDGAYGQYLAYLLVATPAVWLAAARLRWRGSEH